MPTHIPSNVVILACCAGSYGTLEPLCAVLFHPILQHQRGHSTSGVKHQRGQAPAGSGLTFGHELNKKSVDGYLFKRTREESVSKCQT